MGHFGRLFEISMWTESIRHFAEEGQGSVIFLDGSSDNMKRTIHEPMAVRKGVNGANSEKKV
jgi:hypothetical protein